MIDVKGESELCGVTGSEHVSHESFEGGMQLLRHFRLYYGTEKKTRPDREFLRQPA